MSELSQTLHSLPWSGLIPVGLLVFVGLLLWAAGRRVLRAGFILIGLAFGGLAGWIVGDSVKTGAEPWAIMCIGAVVLAVIAGLSYRFAVVAALAMICGVMAPLTILTLSQNQEANASPQPNVVVSKGLMDGLRDILDDNAKIQGDTPAGVKYWRTALKDHDRLGENADKHIEQAKTIAQQAAQVGREAWNHTPQNLRPTLVASSIIGTIAGLLLGIVAPMLGASMVTSLGGSMLWLGGGRVLAAKMGVPDGQWWPAEGSSLLVLWLITATVGLGIQWTFRKRLADKKG